jgi:DNA glycosylase AlkZ-like
VRRPEPGALLDRATLNRTLLARQGLLARTDAPTDAMVEHLVGMQAQVPRDPYIGLWARIADFDPGVLEGMLLERRAVRMTLMRSTLHLATARDAVLLRSVTQPVNERGFRSSPFRRRVAGMDLDALREAGVQLVEAQFLSTSELGRALAERWPGEDAEAMAYAVRYLEPMVQVTPRGLFRHTAAPRLTTLRSWLGGVPGGGAPRTVVDADRPADAALDDVVERYLRAFGPATAADIRTWSGIAGARDVIARLRPRLRAYRDADGRELVDVADGLFAPPDAPAPVRFLGEYDNVFLGHSDRSRITGDLDWGTPWARRGAFFVDGRLSGAWRFPDPSRPGRLVLEPMRPLTGPERDEAAREAAELGRFLADGADRPDVAWA